MNQTVSILLLFTILGLLIILIGDIVSFVKWLRRSLKPVKAPRPRRGNSGGPRIAPPNF